MAAEGMPITPNIVTWARERAGFKLDDAKKDFPKIAKWESGSAEPTYRQLARLADKFKVPIAVFFFPEPPKLPPLEETFRTLGSAQFDEIPPKIRLLLHKARAFQMGLDELNQGRNPAERLITRDLSFQPTEPVESIATQVRDYLGISLEEQFDWNDTNTALQAWRKALFNVGVYVFKDAFRQDDYSGFSLYDSEFPIIYVNNSTTKTRQIFTLFHELAHLLFHTSGVDKLEDDFIDDLAHDNRQIEIICNRLAACMLVPEDVFDQELARRPYSESPEAKATELARLFAVSREVIYRNFLERGLITDTEYRNKAQKWTEQRGTSGNGGGGHYYSTKIAYLGTPYITLAFQRYYQNLISYDQLGDYLDIKPKNLDKLEDHLLRSSS